jgi:pimeloyl-ACP methyl ester carboxylesterase
MHGFPDNLHIWDDLVPYLIASGRRVVTFDFLGFGASDKPAGAAYSFKQQLGDLEAVVEGLGLGKIVPVAHDSSGFASINYALARPEGVDSVIMLDSAYAEDSTFLWPEMVTLFATKSLHALAMAVAQSPEQFGWLLNWQKQKFLDALPETQKPHFNEFLGPLISDNFLHPKFGPRVCAIGGAVLRCTHPKRQTSAGAQGTRRSGQAHLGTVRSVLPRVDGRATQVSVEARVPHPRASGPLAANR